MKARIDTDWHQRFNMGGPRSGPIQGICIHTTENSFGTTAEQIALYQLQSQTGSYHRLVDAAGRTLLANTDDWTTWSTANKGNETLLHVSCVAWAKSTRAQWLAQPKMLDAVAATVAEWSKVHNIPLVKITGADLRAGKRGICGHADARDAWGITTHWDPGPGFPFDVVIDKARALLAAPTPAPAPAPAPKEPAMPSPDDLTLDQHAGPERDDHGNPTFSGWPQLGNRTLVDAVAAIGAALKVPGMRDPK